ncbi:hypothetical protein EX895_002079 [Sporisorium graminicola]|uniref:Uncharacterized protein n=1 Tax=Sporisorium graminicola TaxID=280036 RepID=A0A4U7KZE9_9BASI|nr:hypothetical protein EX895_002079 [Sporisorium graminicola]TKY88838.1 hypothetical protein EX895_002079 [Sporisorium graminicola]
MVVALREQQQPKKSKLSLFRLVKASTKPAPPSPHTRSSHDSQTTFYDSHPAHASSAQQAAPRSSSTNRIIRATRDAESQRGAPPIAVHYQFPEASNLPRNDRWASSTDEYDYYTHAEAQYRRSRADSLPLQGFVHPTEQASAPLAPTGRLNVPALARIQTQAMLPSKHSRQRSHFSIPDVVVTTCEEEGEEQVVELEIPPNKRRSYVLRDASEERGQEQRSFKKSSSATVRRPAPLIRFDTQEMKTIGMTRTGSIPSISSAGSLASLAEVATATSSTPTSSASSSLSKGSTAKRNRKPTFPLLFGRRTSDSSKSNAASQIYVEEPLPYSPTTPTSAPANYGDSFRSAQPDGLLFSSNPTSASTNPPPSRNIFTRAISGLPSPPVTPTSPPRSALRKQMKAKAKEELALIKELERVDKLVKQHDDKARKAQEKIEAKNRKRAAKLAQINQEFERPSLDTRPSVDTFSSGRSQPVPDNRILIRTVFKASTKAPATAGVGRRVSIRGGAAEVRTGHGERRGSEPTLVQSSSPPEQRASGTTPFSVELPGDESLSFSNPRAAPQPNVAPKLPEQTAPLSLSKQNEGRSSLPKNSSPPRPTRPAPAVPIPTEQQESCSEHVADLNVAEADTSISEDADETQVWNHQSFSELSSGFTGPLPSLIQSSACNSAAGFTAVEQTNKQAEEDDQIFDVRGDYKAKLARRASVQRVLALSDAEGARLQKRASLLRKKGSQHQLKRRSCHMDGSDSQAVGGGASSSSKRSSAASSVRRRSFVRPIGDKEGWKVVGASGSEGSTVGQSENKSAPWDDWVEEHPQRRPPSPESTPTQQRVEVQVDLALAHLRAAQDADHLRKQGYTHEQSHGPNVTAENKENSKLDNNKNNFHVLGKTVHVEQDCDSPASTFRLSLALTPLQLQPLDVFSDLDGRP